MGVRCCDLIVRSNTARSNPNPARRTNQSHATSVIGKRDIEAGVVSVRIQGKGNLGVNLRTDAIADILWSIKEQRRD